MKTTTREYDTDGNLTKETVIETPDQPAVVTLMCNCYWRNGGPSGYHYCPVHGYVGRSDYWSTHIGPTAHGTITINGNSQRPDDPPQLSLVS